MVSEHRPDFTSPEDVNPWALRATHPRAYPQYPYDEPPPIKEISAPVHEVFHEPARRVTMTDGVSLTLDVFRPAGRAGRRFPALVGFSPYGRQLQQTDIPILQNEGGIVEFWVRRGYAVAHVDVRGSNESEGEWEMFGARERRDLAEIIEWMAEQPWCTGDVGMLGASYYARTQLMAAIHRPPSLRAIFAYDAATDAYRDTFFHGGIPNEGMHRTWFGMVKTLNLNGAKLEPAAREAILAREREIVGLEHPLDGEYYWERSSWPGLSDIDVPVYFGCHWSFFNLHLRGAFSGWLGTGDITKRMLISPDPQPRRPVAELHQEMLRWYDHWLKGLDTGVLDGPPIRLWIQGADRWRGETEWPLQGTRWDTLYLGGSESGLSGALDWKVGPARERTYAVDPAEAGWLRGEPRLTYRTEPLREALEITGPIELDLRMRSSAGDTDVLVTLLDEAPDGTARVLTKGWLRASHRAVDEARSRRNSPWHPHDEEVPLAADAPNQLRVELVPTCNVFRAGHRVRLEIASCDDLVRNGAWYHRARLSPSVNTVYEGGDSASCLHVPVVDR